MGSPRAQSPVLGFRSQGHNAAIVAGKYTDGLSVQSGVETFSTEQKKLLQSTNAIIKNYQKIGLWMIYVTTPHTLKSSPSVISISGYSGLAGTSQRLPPFLQTRFSVYSPFSSQTAICFSVGFRSLLSTMMMSPSFTPASIIERPCTRIKNEESGCGHSIFNTSMSCASSSLFKGMGKPATTFTSKKRQCQRLNTAGRHHFPQLHQASSSCLLLATSIYRVIHFLMKSVLFSWLSR